MGLLPENSHLLSGLPGRVLADVFANAKTVKLDTNKVLFQAGDPGDGCYRVDEGLLKVSMMSRSGTERILAFMGPGSIVGELSMIDGRPRSAAAVAVRDAALSFLSRSAFEAFAQKRPEIYKSLVTLLATRLRETDTGIAAGSFLPLKGRVAARTRGPFRPGCRLGPCRHPSENRSKRPRRPDRHRARNCQPHS